MTCSRCFAGSGDGSGLFKFPHILFFNSEQAGEVTGMCTSVFIKQYKANEAPQRQHIWGHKTLMLERV